MKLPLTAVLLLMAVCATDAQGEDWVSTVGDITKDVTEKTINGVIDLIKTFGPRIIGKRSIDWRSTLGRVGSSVASALVNELDLACTRFSDLNNKQGLTAGDLRVAFRQTDENKDGRLNNAELGLFENVVDVVQHCLDLAKRRRAGEGK